MAMLEIDSLTVDYRGRGGSIRAVNNVSIALDKSETLGLVGESGSGKTTLGLSIMRLVPHPGIIVGGGIRLNGVDILTLPDEEMRLVRGRKIAYVFQDPMTSLNPVKKIGAHFAEMMRTHEPHITEKAAMARAEQALTDVGIPPERVSDYPHHFSGGMRQRMMIALAIGLNPDLVIADEPTTALDVIVQAKILDLLRKLRDTYGMALILITHDLSIVLERCDRIAVMYAGAVVEHATGAELHRNPLHPYTQGLLRSIPNIGVAEQKLEAIPGSPPNLLDLPNGCCFCPRCLSAKEKCSAQQPEMVDVGSGHMVRCFKEAA